MCSLSLNLLHSKLDCSQTCLQLVIPPSKEPMIGYGCISHLFISFAFSMLSLFLHVIVVVLVCSIRVNISKFSLNNNNICFNWWSLDIRQCSNQTYSARVQYIQPIADCEVVCQLSLVVRAVQGYFEGLQAV